MLRVSTIDYINQRIVDGLKRIYIPRFLCVLVAYSLTRTTQNLYYILFLRGFLALPLVLSLNNGQYAKPVVSASNTACYLTTTRDHRSERILGGYSRLHFVFPCTFLSEIMMLTKFRCSIKLHVTHYHVLVLVGDGTHSKLRVYLITYCRRSENIQKSIMRQKCL